MKTGFILPATCDICGGAGVTNSRGNYAMWTGGSVSHTDPSICKANLARKAESLKQLEAKLNEQKANNEQTNNKA